MQYFTNQNSFFFDQAIQDAIAHAKECFPEEACGAVIDDEYVRFANAADDRENSFLISDSEFDAAYQAGEVQAVIHSHNASAKASQPDQEQQMALGVPFGVINLVNRSVTHFVFWGDSLPVEPLTRRPFFYGVWDCFSLVRDYFRLKHKYLMPNIPREHGWWLRGESMFEPYMKQFDVTQVSLEIMQPNDILLYNLHGQTHVNHAAVMQEDGLVLHHFENHTSQALPKSFNQQYLRSAWRIRGVS